MPSLSRGDPGRHRQGTRQTPPHTGGKRRGRSRSQGARCDHDRHQHSNRRRVSRCAQCGERLHCGGNPRTGDPPKRRTHQPLGPLSPSRRRGKRDPQIDERIDQLEGQVRDLRDNIRKICAKDGDKLEEKRQGKAQNLKDREIIEFLES